MTLGKKKNDNMETFKNAFAVLSRMSELLRTTAEFRDWMDRCDETIRHIVAYQRGERVPVWEKQRMVSLLARTQTLRAIVRGRLSRLGCGHVARATSPKVLWEELETAFERRLLTGAVINVGAVDPRKFFENARRTVISRVTNAITEQRSVSVNTVLNAEFMLRDDTDVKSFATHNRVLLMSSNVREWFAKQVVAPTLIALEEFQERESGWTLRTVQNLLINVKKHNPLRAGCDVPLRRVVLAKKAVVNVQCNDNTCFLWSVVASLFPATAHGDRIASYPPYATVLRTDGVRLPMYMDQVQKFEADNDVSVNIYMWSDEDGCVPLRVSDNKREGRHANVLLVQDPKDSQRYHFACIRSLSRLISGQLSKHGHRVFVCDR